MDKETKARRFSFGSFVLGVLVGAAAGAAAGLLLAPKAGAESLRELKDKFQQQQGSAGKLSEEGSQQVKTWVEDTRQGFGAKIALARQAFEAGKQAAIEKHQQLNTADAESEPKEDSQDG